MSTFSDIIRISTAAATALERATHLRYDDRFGFDPRESNDLETSIDTTDGRSGRGGRSGGSVCPVTGPIAHISDTPSYNFRLLSAAYVGAT